MGENSSMTESLMSLLHQTMEESRKQREMIQKLMEENQKLVQEMLRLQKNGCSCACRKSKCDAVRDHTECCKSTCDHRQSEQEGMGRQPLNFPGAPEKTGQKRHRSEMEDEDREVGSFICLNETSANLNPAYSARQAGKPTPVQVTPVPVFVNPSYNANTLPTSAPNGNKTNEELLSTSSASSPPATAGDEVSMFLSYDKSASSTDSWTKETGTSYKPKQRTAHFSHDLDEDVGDNGPNFEIVNVQSVEDSDMDDLWIPGSFGQDRIRQTSKRTEVRRIYNNLVTRKVIDGFDLRESLNSAHNLEVCEKVMNAAMKDKLRKHEIEGALQTYYRSLKDQSRRVIKGQNDNHKLRCRRQGRKREKLRNLERGLQLLNWSDAEKERTRSVLTLDYISSEESDCVESITDGDLTLKRYVVKRFQWESKILQNMKKEMMEKFYETLTPKQVEIRKKRVGGTVWSDRPVPNNAPTWALVQSPSET